MNLLNKIQALRRDPNKANDLAVFADWFEESGVGELAGLFRGKRNPHFPDVPNFVSQMKPAALFPEYRDDAFWIFCPHMDDDLKRFGQHEGWPAPSVRMICQSCRDDSLRPAMPFDLKEPLQTFTYNMLEMRVKKILGKREIFFIGAGQCSQCKAVSWSTTNLQDAIFACEEIERLKR
jgi:hypothetical protein